MKKSYALKPLENIVNQLTPNTTESYNQETIDGILQKIANEKINIYNQFQSLIFHLKDEDHIRVTVQKYYKAVINLINQVYQLSLNTPLSENNKLEIISYLSFSLEELQHFIEVEYPHFLSPEERVPLPELMVTKAEMEEQFLLLPAALKAGNNGEKIINILMEALGRFVDRIDRQEIITVKENNYHKEMIRNLLNPKEQPRVLPDCPSLHELLFYWNFNSNESIAYFTTGLEDLFKHEDSPEAKLEFLHFQFKRLLHLPVKPKTIYDKRYPSMKSYFSAWITNEINYLQQKTEGFTPLSDNLSSAKEKVSPFKVLLDLSTDQTGIILRGADEARILVAKSLSSVFKSIVPYISTRRKENPSWETMRSRTYNPERREVALAVDALERIIAVIKSY